MSTPPPDPTTPIPGGSSGYPPPAGGASPAGVQPSQPGAPGGPLGTSAGGGFLNALFDFSFNRFITPMIIRAVYLISAVVIGLTWFLLLISAFSQGAVEGLAVLFLGPIVAIIYLAFIRMTLEIYLAVVRMSEDIHQRLPKA